MKNRVYDNGIYREMTEEEMKNSTAVPETAAAVSPEERLAALEAAFIEMAGVVFGG